MAWAESKMTILLLSVEDNDLIQKIFQDYTLYDRK
jgi:hypothetical protein